MSTNYDDLAKKFGAVSAEPNYDAIAKGLGAVEQPAGKPKNLMSMRARTPLKDAVKRLGTGLYDFTIQPFKDIGELQKQNVEKYGNFPSTLVTMFDLAKGLLKSS
jgi:hypothetical protein